MAETFIWGSGGQKLSPAQAAARRRIADQMLSSTTAATTLGGGLAKVGDALKGIYYDKQASEAEAAGANERKAVLDALMGNSDPSMGDLYGAMGNEWVSSDPASMAVIQAMMGQEMQQNDPLRQLQIQQAQQGLDKGTIELEQLRNPQPEPDYGFTFAPDGSLIRTDKTSGGFEELGDFAAPADPNRAPTVQKVLLEDGSEMAVQWDGATQKWVPIDAPEGGGTLKPGNGLTEGQAKLTLFQSLQTETQPVLLDLESQFNPGNLQDAAARSTPVAGNFFQSEQGQIYNSAATAWAEGALRIATGAAATPEEMERTKRAYFAQPGDTPNTIAFKAQMREMYNRAIQRSLGQETSGQLPKPSEFADQMGGGVSSEALPQVGEEVDGYVYQGGDPASPSSWKQVM